ncbi:N-6 DNA methylase [Gelidibacter sp. F2691]|nr:N-6 DNA methylase [Gelidibacter sp. F2691]
MGEDNYMEKGDVIKLTEQFWQPIGILRGVLPVEQHHLFLFLLSSYYDGVIKKEMFDREVNYEELFYFLEDDNRYCELLDIYKPIINDIPEWPLLDIIEEFSKIANDIPELVFNKVFDNLLFKLTSNQGKFSGEFLLPSEVSSLVMELIDIPNRAKVFNPFAGLASFATHLNNAQSYYGQEIVNSTWALGKLRLLRLEKSSIINVDYRVEDSINNWPESNDFDLVISNPPFNYKVNSLKAYQFGKKKMTAEAYVINRGLESINSDGQVACVISPGLLFSGGEERNLRQYLVEEGLIETIVSLPGGILQHTAIPICILFLARKRNSRNVVKFIDATSFVIKEGKAKMRLDNEKLLADIKAGVNTEFIKEVNIETIRDNDFNLSVNRYFIKPVEGKKLPQFASFDPGYTFDDSHVAKFVQIKDLKNDVFDCELNIDTLEEKDSQENKTIFIDKPCILIAAVGSSIKPTYFAYEEEEPIALGAGIIAIVINQKEVNPFFLINEFSADYIQNQLKGYRVGSIAPYIANEDLHNLVFKLPSLREQNIIIEGILTLSQKVKNLELEKDNLIYGRKIEETDSSTSLSHVLGKPLLSIGSSLEIIQNVMWKLDPNWKDIVINESRQFRMADAFESIIKNIEYIQELVDDNTALVNVSAFLLTELQFLEFLIEFVDNEQISLPRDVTLKLEIHDDIKQITDDNIIVRGNRQKLKIVLLNLIDNIKRHAFVEDFKIHDINIEVLPFIANEDEAKDFNYEINSKQAYIEIKVSNTGKSFPIDLNLEDYIRKNFSVGSTKNKGLGGYEINEILKVHNYGKRALNILRLDEDQEFSSTVSFIIPII